MKAGDIVKFTEASNEQVQWGGNDDPRKLLVIGNDYVVKEVEVHSWHTKIYLEGVKGKFNSVHFTEVQPKDAEDLINEKYNPFKEDFELLWDERNEYKTFENWWIDFIRYKLYGK